MPDGLPYRGMRGGNWYNGETTAMRGSPTVIPATTAARRIPTTLTTTSDFVWPARLRVPPTVDSDRGPVHSTTPGPGKATRYLHPSTTRTTYLINNQGMLVHSWTGSQLRAGTIGLSARERPPAARCDDQRAAQHRRRRRRADRGIRLGRATWSGNSIIPPATYMSAPRHQAAAQRQHPRCWSWRRRPTTRRIAAGFNPAKFQPEIQQQGLHAARLRSSRSSPTRPSGGTVVWAWHVWDHLIQDYRSPESQLRRRGGSPGADRCRRRRQRRSRRSGTT